MQPIDAQRRTGRSTAIALRIVAEAYANPNKNISIKDHHGSHGADEHLMYMVIKFIQLLRLDGFYCDGKSLKYEAPELWHDRQNSMSRP